VYIVAALLRAPGAVEVLVASVAVGILVCVVPQGKAGAVRVVAGLFVLSLGVIAAVTVTPGLAASGRSLGDRLHLCPSYFPAAAARFDALIPTGAEGVLNVALCVPAAVFAGLLVRRWWVVVAGGSVLSLGIELYQGLAGTRSCSGADWAQNTEGVVLGVLLGLVIAMLSRSALRRRNASAPIGGEH
jgi:hypothetical protein